ncbi:MAG: IclR family transcriptional regulator [Pseudomonadota bacterium]
MRRKTGLLVDTLPMRDEAATSQDPGRQYVTALARGLSILRAFTSGEASLGNQELAERTGLTNPTVSRLTFTLTKLGYLAYSPQTGRYRLGMSALAFGYWAMANNYVRQIAKPLMEQASRELNLCCALGYREQLEMVYLEHARGSGALMLRLEPGSRTPITTTAMGRAIIAVMEEGEREALMHDLKDRHPETWPALKQGVVDSIKDYRTRGFTISAGDWEREINAVGIPLVLQDGYQPMALILAGAVYTLSREQLIAEVGPRLVQLARQVEEGLKTIQNR